MNETDRAEAGVEGVRANWSYLSRTAVEIEARLTQKRNPATVDARGKTMQVRALDEAFHQEIIRSWGEPPGCEKPGAGKGGGGFNP